MCKSRNVRYQEICVEPSLIMGGKMVENRLTQTDRIGQCLRGLGRAILPSPSPVHHWARTRPRADGTPELGTTAEAVRWLARVKIGQQEDEDHGGAVRSRWDGRKWLGFYRKDRPTVTVAVWQGPTNSSSGDDERGSEKLRGSSVKVTVGSATETAAGNGWN